MRPGKVNRIPPPLSSTLALTPGRSENYTVRMASVHATRPRVGLLGGTFDPVHLGHLSLAESALEAFALDHVLFIPSAVTPHKRHRPITATRHRLAMLRLALADRPRLALSTVELDRGGVSYTVDTLAALRGRHSDWDLWLLLGMDSLRDLHLWHRAADLLALCTVATLERPGVDRPLAEVPGFPPEVSRALLRTVARGRPVAVSSSDIRARIAQRQPIEIGRAHV